MLMLAADKGNWEVCMKLAEFGADLNLTDRVSETYFKNSTAAAFAMVSSSCSSSSLD